MQEAHLYEGLFLVNQGVDQAVRRLERPEKTSGFAMEVCKDAVTTIERTWNRLKRETQHALSAEHATREDKAHHFMQQILLTLGERIRAKRQRKRLSQEKFAEVCGLHRTEVGLLERGQTIPRLDTLLIVSEHLGLPPSKLLKGFKHKSTLLQGLRIQAFQDHEAKS